MIIDFDHLHFDQDNTHAPYAKRWTVKLSRPQLLGSLASQGNIFFILGRKMEKQRKMYQLSIKTYLT